VTLRPHTQKEIETLSEALERASGKKLFSKAASKHLSDDCAYADWVLGFSRVPSQVRTRRRAAVLRAVKKVRRVLQDLRGENYCSLSSIRRKPEEDPRCPPELWPRVQHLLAEPEADALPAQMAQLDAQLKRLENLAASMQRMEEEVREAFPPLKWCRPIDQTLEDLIRTYAEGWEGVTRHPPSAWRDAATGEYRGDFWIFIRNALAPLSERLGAKGSDGALFSRVERICRTFNSATVKK